ncbi:tyrosine-type recombinase/integrase [Paraburkholderia sp. 1N]|uniref:Tyrosine-type recombinase/integrase n=1 Tax=Paraburkholderia solitsugae TaxID=2675748 RepID=A0ABX2BK23_9BURK|nr:site-specific integrase [Paraburkholderia solitsugae]NPT41257.1 tyrosine-type recombinase/integrase [Paraburkholderia solitsugae]
MSVPVFRYLENLLGTLLGTFCGGRKQGEIMPVLTVKGLQALKAENAGDRLPDGEGLYGLVRIRAEDRVSVLFRWRFRHGGKLHDFNAGTWPGVALTQIRKNRDEAEQILSTGVNPNDHVKKRRLAAHAEVIRQAEEAKAKLAQAAAEADALRTVQDAFDTWKTSELSSRKDSGAELERAWKKDVLPSIGVKPLRDVTAGDVLAITDAIKLRGAARLARRTFGEVRQFIAWAARRDLIAIDCTAKVKKSKEFQKDTERSRVLSEAEIKALAAALPAANLQDATRRAIMLMLSTLCRVGELSRAEWTNVDLEARRWRIPADHSKNSKEHIVLLSDFAVQQFEALKTISGARRWCYPSPNEEQHIDTKSIGKQIKDRQRATPLKNRSSAVNSLRMAGGLWTPHDLRRSGATLMGELGIAGDVIEKCLNHTEENGLKKIYQRQKLEPEQAAAWQVLGQRLALLVSPDTNVIVAKFGKSA